MIKQLKRAMENHGKDTISMTPPEILDARDHHRNKTACSSMLRSFMADAKQHEVMYVKEHLQIAMEQMPDENQLQQPLTEEEMSWTILWLKVVKCACLWQKEVYTSASTIIWCFCFLEPVPSKMPDIKINLKSYPGIVKFYTWNSLNFMFPVRQVLSPTQNQHVFFVFLFRADQTFDLQMLKFFVGAHQKKSGTQQEFFVFFKPIVHQLGIHPQSLTARPKYLNSPLI